MKLKEIKWKMLKLVKNERIKKIKTKVEEAANYKDHLKRKKKGNSLLMKQWVFKSKEKKKPQH